MHNLENTNSKILTNTPQEHKEYVKSLFFIQEMSDIQIAAAEAITAFRNGKFAELGKISNPETAPLKQFITQYEGYGLGSVEDKLAEIILYVTHVCIGLNISIDELLQKKTEYHKNSDALACNEQSSLITPDLII